MSELSPRRGAECATFRIALLRTGFAITQLMEVHSHIAVQALACRTYGTSNTLPLIPFATRA